MYLLRKKPTILFFKVSIHLRFLISKQKHLMSKNTVEAEVVQYKPSLAPGSNFLSPISFQKQITISVHSMKMKCFYNLCEKRK